MKAGIVRCAVAASVALSATTIGWASPASAGGGSAGAVGSGDQILSSIVAWANSTRSGSVQAAAPPCRWHRLTDRQVIFLIHVLASMPELRDSGFQRALDEYLRSDVLVTEHLPAAPTPPDTGEGSGDAPADTPGPGPADPPDGSDPTGPTVAMDPTDPPGPTDTDESTDTTESTDPADPEDPVHAATRVTVRNFELRVEVCNGVARTMRVASRTIDGNDGAAVAVAASGRARRLRTLPPPQPVFSPQAMATPAGPALRALLGEPVFVDVAPPGTQQSTLTFAGRTVHAHATPTSLEVFVGEDSPDVGRTVSCPFHGGYDATAGSPPLAVQAADGCTFTYYRATGGERRDYWAGYVLMEWDGHYTIDDDPTPHPLANLFSFAPFAIAVDEIESVIEG